MMQKDWSILITNKKESKIDNYEELCSFLLLKYNQLKRAIIKVTAYTLSVLYKYVTFTFNEPVFIEYVCNIFLSLDSNGRESRNVVMFLKLLKMI